MEYTVDCITLIMKANDMRGLTRKQLLTELIETIELLILHVRMADELNLWGNQKTYLFIAEKLVDLSQQAEGWRKSTAA